MLIFRHLLKMLETRIIKNNEASESNLREFYNLILCENLIAQMESIV